MAQLTLLGSPETVEVSTFYKEPVGYPTLLGLLFAVTGTSEGGAFFFARVLFSLAVGSVYLLARDNFRQPWMGWLAALAFLATPPVLEYSVSAGTDLGTVLFAVLGVWGLVSGAYPVAVAALALVAQMRLETVVFTLFLFASPSLGRWWKLIGLALISGQLFHLVWVLSAAPAYASSVGVEAAFSPGYVPANFIGSLGYLLDGGRFPWGISVLAALSLLSWSVRTILALFVKRDWELQKVGELSYPYLLAVIVKTKAGLLRGLRVGRVKLLQLTGRQRRLDVTLEHQSGRPEVPVTVMLSLLVLGIGRSPCEVFCSSHDDEVFGCSGDSP